jgi:hypothetical protein
LAQAFHIGNIQIIPYRHELLLHFQTLQIGETQAS